jgi:cobalt-zinc-cadmium efflux system protein
VDPEELKGDLGEIEGVIDVHDLHLWTLTSGMEVATAHVRIRTGVDSDRVLIQAKSLLQERHHVAHATLQVEGEEGHCEGCIW